MPNIYECIAANRGVFAVFLYPKAIYKHFSFTDAEQDLKIAIIKSIKKGVSTYIVDELLKYTYETIGVFIVTLIATNQQQLVKYFYEIDPMADKCLENYQSVVKCKQLIPTQSIFKLAFNRTRIRIILINNHALWRNAKLVTALCNARVISEQCKCAYLAQNIPKFINGVFKILINGNAEQYRRFCSIIKQMCPDVLMYL